MNPWTWWVTRTERLMDARVLALVRILICTCLALDLLRVLQIGMVDPFYTLYEHGGINAHPDGAARVVDWFGPQGGVYAYWTSLVCFLLAAFGILTRPAMLLGVLAYAQVGHIYSPGDRGIDRITRTVLLVLVFSGAHKRLALGLKALPGMRRDWISAWPMDLLKWLMVMVYLSAGIAKLMQNPNWLGMPDTAIVYRIMTDPMAAHIDPQSVEGLWPLFTFFGWATIVVELSAPILLTRWGRYWSLLALPMHVGIATTMELGMFSYAMMSMHLLLLYPWLLPLLDRIPWLRNAQDPPAGAMIERGRGPEPASPAPSTAPG
ncbi:MAG: HTTM domain-containing protein [Alphaproteobacteria bacterium]|nr:HTTM domain-containing protein [Alphaproteobacteria bacterium]